jgi:hypothetical protein
MCNNLQLFISFLFCPQKATKMPLPKRQVEPIHVARNTLPADLNVPSELEAVTNGTLANTVRQLSSLSRHAEDLFGELQKEAATIAARATSVQTRIDRLAIKVTQLDSGGEEGTPDLLPPHHQQKPLRESLCGARSVLLLALASFYSTFTLFHWDKGVFSTYF